MNSRKYIYEIEVGDLVSDSNNLYRVDRVGKTRFQATIIASGYGDNYGVGVTQAFTTRNGKMVGQNHYVDVWFGDMIDFNNAQAAKREQKKAVEQLRADRKNKAIEVARANNPVLSIVDVPGSDELKMVNMIDQNGKAQLIFFVAEEGYDIYTKTSDGSYDLVTNVHLTKVSVFGARGLSDNVAGWSQPYSREMVGDTIEDALINLISWL